MVSGGESFLSSSVRVLDPISHFEQGKGDMGSLPSL